MDLILLLEDGTIFEGTSFGYEKEVTGEIVFNTGMTGYQEILTDPSYYGQIVAMTYPLIGNYGVNKDDYESIRPQVRGFITREACKRPSNFRSEKTIDEYLKKYEIPGIEGIDTRALTKILREKGTMKGIIVSADDFNLDESMDKIKKFRIKNPVEEVTIKEPKTYGDGDGLKVALMDYGVKNNIIRSLVDRGLSVTVFPSTTSADEILNNNYDGIMLSNGPGDPKDCKVEINNLKKLIGKLPIFAICLGHQLMALANGGDTTKLKYGHRGCNHPVKDVKNDRTYISSQNHGYTIIEDSLDKERMDITFINMNDMTVEGVRYKDVPVFTVQFHPEASPGPDDTSYLFDEFIKMMDGFKNSKGV